jgi:pimeloyl-ACP methyl ester carboxylesterase
MELAAKLLRSFDFLPNHSRYVKDPFVFDRQLLTTRTQTLPTAHWTQLEKPTEVNGIIRKWLTEIDSQRVHPRDEL